MKEDGVCYYCGEATLEAGLVDRRRETRTRDHVVSRKHRRSGQVVPIVEACYWCNHTKGTRLILEWVKWLQLKQRGGWPNGWDQVAIRKASKTIERWHQGRIHNYKPPPFQSHVYSVDADGVHSCSCGAIDSEARIHFWENR